MRLIDADALIHELNNSHYPGAPYIDAGISIAIGKVCDAPTIEPERLKGHWIPLDEDSDEYECDVCRTTYDTVCGTFDLPDFCPHCGANMRGEQE